MAKKIKRFFVFLLFSMCFSLVSKKVQFSSGEKSINGNVASNAGKQKSKIPTLSLTDNSAMAAGFSCACSEGGWYCN